MSTKDAAPYKPSWINHLSNWIDGLPGPNWGYYIGLGALLIIVQGAISWIEGAVPVGNFLSVNIFLVAAISFIMGIISYFDIRAQSALESIKPSLTINEIKFKTFSYEFTTLPALNSILASFLALIFLFLTELIGGGSYYIEILAGYPISMNLSRVIYLVCWWFFGIFIYHTIHQLRLINKIYTHHTKIDLFRMKPLYEFSNMAAFSASSLLILPYGFLYINPDVQLTNPIILITYLIISAIAFITFLWPQLGIHHLQNEEKESLLWQINKRYKATMGEVHKRVDLEQFDSAATLVDTLAALSNESGRIKGISTWPWQPETIRWLFTATVLPLLMWIAQYLLGQWLNP